MTTFTVLIAPSGFKESLDAPEVADAIAAGVRRVVPDATIRRAPVADGGEGFTRAVVAATHGVVVERTVSGPVGEPVVAPIGLYGPTHECVAVIEMAAAAGLRLVPRDLRDPRATTTLGVGELIRHALDLGARRLLIGCGDSGTNDGGMGAAHALGIRFLDASGAVLEPIGANLGRVATIDLRGRDPRLDTTTIEVACNPDNVLCGERGVARIYGPQKGASPEEVEMLADGLEWYAAAIHRATGVDVRTAPGTGASGGLGAGLSALLGAQLCPRWEVIGRYLDLDGLIDDADLVITAEGSLDHQTPHGKLPAELARRAEVLGVPVLALAGTIGDGAASTLRAGISAYTSVLQRPCSLSEAIGDTTRLLVDAAEQAMRFVEVGRRLAVAA
jgi:glycerate kinase